MLGLKGVLVTRTIQQDVVVKVAKGAQEQVLHDIEDHSQETGRAEQLVDSLLFGGVKKAALSQIHGMSHHAASLHQELQKNVTDRNPELVKTHEQELSKTQQTLSELIRGDSLEYGQEYGRPIVGRDSYLIHRSPSRILPSGVPLYHPEERGYPVPSFKKVTDIRGKNIQTIRSSGKTSDEGVISCEGKIYKIKFDVRNMPTVLTDKFDEKWRLVQFRLTSLWEVNEKLFVLQPSGQRHHPVPVALPDPAIGPVAPGIVPGPVIPATAPVLQESDDVLNQTAIPRFSSYKNIIVDSFARIEKAQQLICNGKTCHVRFHRHREPILLRDNSDPDLKLIQFQLHKIWFVVQARRGLKRLSRIRPRDATLFLSTSFPDTETELFRTRARFGLDAPWENTRINSTGSFAEFIPLLARSISVDKIKLEEILNKLDNDAIPAESRRNVYLNAETSLHDIAVRQNNMNRNIDDLKDIVSQLLQLASKCTSFQVQKIILEKIAAFCAFLIDFTRTDMRGDSVAKLNGMMQCQLLFIKKFPTSQTAFQEVTDALPDAHLSDSTTLITPRTPNLTALIDDLCALSTNLMTSWRTIQDTIQKIRLERTNTVRLFTMQINHGLDLNREIQKLLGTEGLNPDNGMSFYTPKTCARIVTLRQIRAELLNRYAVLSESQINDMLRESREHIQHVRRETSELLEYAKSDQFQTHRMYKPELTTGQKTLMNFSQWCDDQKSRERE